MFTVELYRKVRHACRTGMNERAAARHYGISRDSVWRMQSFSVPPGFCPMKLRWGWAKATAIPIHRCRVVLNYGSLRVGWYFFKFVDLNDGSLARLVL